MSRKNKNGGRRNYSPRAYSRDFLKPTPIERAVQEVSSAASPKAVAVSDRIACDDKCSYEYKRMPAAWLETDFSYQRKIDAARVDRIVNSFDPRLANEVKVSFRDGKFYVFDGAHTLSALKRIHGEEAFMLSAVAQEESHMKSEIMNISIEHRFSRGIFLTPELLGYDRDDEGNLVVNESEAQTVKVIYYLYLNGFALCEIARLLTDYRRETKLGNQKWSPGSIAGVLRNERHCGDVLARKTYTPSFLNHKSKKNVDERTKYRQRDHHEAIVSREVYNAANHLQACRKYSAKSRPLPRLSVVDKGVLKGYVPIDKDWTGFSLEEYQAATESVYEVEQKVVLRGKVIDMTGYQVAREQFFSTNQNPAMTISRGKMRFNTGCLRKFQNVEYVELLLNTVSQCIAIRPCEKSNPNAIHWGRLRDTRWIVKDCSCRGFARTLCELMEWEDGVRYRLRGRYIQNGGMRYMLFALEEPEMIRTEEIVVPIAPDDQEDDNEEIVIKKVVKVFPSKWEHSFGRPMTALAQAGVLTQAHYAGDWDVLRPAREIEEMNVFTTDSLAALMHEAEEIMEGWN